MRLIIFPAVHGGYVVLESTYGHQGESPAALFAGSLAEAIEYIHKALDEEAKKPKPT